MTAEIYIRLKDGQTITLDHVDIESIAIKYPRRDFDRSPRSWPNTDGIYKTVPLSAKLFNIMTVGNSCKKGTISHNGINDVVTGSCYEIHITPTDDKN